MTNQPKEKEKSLLKDSFFLNRIRQTLEEEQDAYKMIFEINRIIKKWETVER